MSKKSILLINVGTPDQADNRSVRRYLREFLNDPRVVALPIWIRWPLVNLFIVPFRYKKTAALYRKIWTNLGSPLLRYNELIKQKLAAELGEEYHVELGMRYGKPSIQTALKNLKNTEELTVVPLFPQYSSATTASAIENFLMRFSTRWNMPSLKIINDFYQHPGFIHAFAERIKQTLQDKKVDLILFSYHGLPEHHIDKSNCQAACDRVHACPVMSDKNHFCYRAQCYATTRSIAQQLNLNEHQYAVSFQSRLGRTPWIKPYTDLLLPELRAQGVKNIAVVSPSFVTDCLETLEEINIRAREQWHELGGDEFIFIPCVNDDPLWIKALADIVR